MKTIKLLEPVLLKRFSFTLALPIFLVLSWNIVAYADWPSDLDSTFNATGIVTTSIGSDTDGGEAIAILPTGRIVVAGGSFENGKFNFAVIRYTSNGEQDTDFNGSGIVTTSVGSGFDGAHSLAVQTDGKIVVAGESVDNNLDNKIAVIRYNSNGSLDSDFNTTGIVTTSLGNSSDYGKSIAVQSDGKIVVGGYSYSNIFPFYDIAVVRYTITGSLDSAFNNTGIVTTPIKTNASSRGNSVVIQDDGKIVVAGSSEYDVAVVRYTTTGELDTSFNGTGVVTTSIGTSAYGASAAIQPDGKIIVVGESDTNFAIVRYTSTGSLDTEFNNTGIVTTTISSGNDQATAVAIQADGKIVVVGGSNGNSNFDVTLVRYNQNGSLDISLNSTGVVTTPVSVGSDAALAVAIQTDGKIVVSGLTARGNRYDIAVMRYLGGELDLTYLPVILKNE